MDRDVGLARTRGPLTVARGARSSTGRPLHRDRCNRPADTDRPRSHLVVAQARGRQHPPRRHLPLGHGVSVRLLGRYPTGYGRYDLVTEGVPTQIHDGHLTSGFTHFQLHHGGRLLVELGPGTGRWGTDVRLPSDSTSVRPRTQPTGAMP
jgi:hypothetical protein